MGGAVPSCHVHTLCSTWLSISTRVQEYSEDPVLASIEFAKQMARTAGRQPMYAGPLQQAINAEQRLYKERLQRALYARWGGLEGK